VNQGLILGEDGQKMSKTRGNVINPDDILVDFGADAFRLYEMFMGPLEMVKPWTTTGVEGVYRFLGRVWRLFIDPTAEAEFEQACTAEPAKSAEWLAEVRLLSAIRSAEPDTAQQRTLHGTIKKVTEDLEGLRFNTAISALMIFTNEAMTWKTKPADLLADFLVLLHPFAPHLAEELWAKMIAATLLAHRDPQIALAYQPWPTFDPKVLFEDQVELPIQINGKLRHRITVSRTAGAEEIKAAVLAEARIQSFLEGKNIRKWIIVPGKLVNLVVD
jgi:leucyl-tRNA synthetase